MAVIHFMIVGKYSSSCGKVTFLGPADVRLGCVIYFGQWNMTHVTYVPLEQNC